MSFIFEPVFVVCFRWVTPATTVNAFYSPILNSVSK